MKINARSRLIAMQHEKVFAAFDIGLFHALRPPGLPMKVIRFDGCHKDGITHVLLGGMEWISRNTEVFQEENEIGFADEGETLPFFLKYWKHRHRVIQISDSTSIIADEVEFRSYNIICSLLIYPLLWFSFVHRKWIYHRYFKKLVGKNPGGMK